MGLDYRSQILSTLVGTKSATNTLTGVALTAAYQAETTPQTTPTKSFDVGGHSRVEFAISYTEGATETANSIQMIVEWSPDGTNFYRLSNDGTVAGVDTMTAREFTFTGADAANSKITWGLDIAYKDLLRVSFKETGEASNFGTVYCEALLSGR